MPSGSPSVEVGSDQNTPLNDFSVLLGPHRVLDDLDLGVDAGVLPHALDGFRHLLVVGEIGDGRLDDDLLVLVAGRLEEIARLAGVVGQGAEAGVVVVVALGDRSVRHDAAPAPQLLDDRLAVDRERQRLLHQRIVERRPFAVDGHHVEPGVERAGHARRRGAGHALALVGGELRDDVHLALEQRGDARRGLRDRAHHEAIEVRLAAPVAVVGLDHELVVLGPRHELHGAGADGLGVERVVAGRLHVLLGDDLAAVEGQARRQQWIGFLGVDHQRRRVGRVDLVDRGQRGGDHRLHVRVVRALDAELGVGGGERITVVILHARAQLERPRGRRRQLPLGGEPGMELAVGMAAREVVEEVERPADVVGRRAEVRVQPRQVAALGDDQFTLLGRLGAGGAGQRRRDCGGGAERGGGLQEISSRQMAHTLLFRAWPTPRALRQRRCGLFSTPRAPCQECCNHGQMLESRPS